MSVSFGKSLVIDRITSLPEVSEPYFVIDILTSKPQLNFNEMGGHTLIGFFMGCLEAIMTQEKVQRNMEGYERTVLESSHELLPACNDIETAYPFVAIYLTAYLSKGNTSSLSSYSVQVAKDLGRYLNKLDIAADDDYLSKLQIKVTSLRVLKEFVDTSPQVKNLIGRTYLGLLIAPRKSQIYSNYAKEHYKHVCYYNMQWAKMIEICFDRKALHPSSRDPDLFATVKYIRIWIENVKENYGDHWSMVGFLDSDKTKDITNRLMWTQDYIKLAMAASDYDKTYESFMIGNVSIIDYKNADHYLVQGKWYKEYGRPTVESVLPSVKDGKRGYNVISNKVRKNEKPSKMKKILSGSKHEAPADEEEYNDVLSLNCLFY